MIDYTSVRVLSQTLKTALGRHQWRQFIWVNFFCDLYTTILNLKKSNKEMISRLVSP